MGEQDREVDDPKEAPLGERHAAGPVVIEQVAGEEQRRGADGGDHAGDMGLHEGLVPDRRAGIGPRPGRGISPSRSTIAPDHDPARQEQGTRSGR